MNDRTSDVLVAAYKLRNDLKDAEAGSNEHGPYWNTAKLIKALREFYKEMPNG